MTESENQQFQVVLNDEQQYSIFPTGRELPVGWQPEGTSGTKDECLAHIDQIWSDMRPLSLRGIVNDD